MKIYSWIKFYISVPLMLIGLIFSFNFIIDPYSMTSYNLLKIPNKLSRDDRKEKVGKLYIESKYDNILFGSSRVYGMNPLVMKKYLGGRTYNAGVGAARIEDILGFLLYLKDIQKLPKNIVVGLDFYTFNQNLETNKYFLVNDELNFLQKNIDNDLYFSKFLSLDALRASYKTLENFLKDSKEHPRFDQYGAAGTSSENFMFFPEDVILEVFDDNEIHIGYKTVKTVKYDAISSDRMKYLDTLISLCEQEQIKTIFFVTPVSGQLLSTIQDDAPVAKSMIEFKKKISIRTEYYDFLTHNEVTDNRFYFSDALHTKAFTGNLVFSRIFKDKKMNLPGDFGVFVQKRKD